MKVLWEDHTENCAIVFLLVGSFILGYATLALVGRPVTPEVWLNFYPLMFVLCPIITGLGVIVIAGFLIAIILSIINGIGAIRDAWRESK